MTRPLYILLADDDRDDAELFQDVLDELPLSTRLETVFSGDQLMVWLKENISEIPDVLFLDLNMPRKTGFECLSEIKQDETLKHLPVIIFSTSIDKEIVNILYKNGAHYYIRKPNEYSKLKEVIHLALELISKPGLVQSSRKEFVLSQENFYNEKN